MPCPGVLGRDEPPLPSPPLSLPVTRDPPFDSFRLGTPFNQPTFLDDVPCLHLLPPSPLPSLHLHPKSPSRLSSLSPLHFTPTDLIAYSDESSLDLQSSVVGVSFIGVVALVGAVFALLAKSTATTKGSYELTETEANSVSM